MNFKDLTKLIKTGESETLEFKSNTGKIDEGFKTICGFLNNKGGNVLFAVKNNGEIIGQGYSDDTEKKIASKIQKFEPNPKINIYPLRLDNDKYVICANVKPCPNERPFIYDGRAYKRVRTTTIPMSQVEYEKLLLERKFSSRRWENAKALELNLNIIDLNEVYLTIQQDRSEMFSQSISNPDHVDIMKKLGLVDDNDFVNAAIVLYGKNFENNFPQCNIHMARFKGNDKTEFIDQHQVYGHAFLILKEAEIFLKRHISISGATQRTTLIRKDKPEYPLEALREALVNAICHRDYSNQGGSIKLAIYDDYLEISSFGTLPMGITIDDLKVSHTSILRNPTIADIFYRRRLIEKWGSGTQKIIDLCLKDGLPEPIFEEKNDSLYVRLLTNEYVDNRTSELRIENRRNEIIRILEGGEYTPRELKNELKNQYKLDEIQNDLAILKKNGLVGLKEREIDGISGDIIWYLIKDKK